MKKGSSRLPDELRPEYDLAMLGPGVRGKYAGRLKGTTLVALQPEVAAAISHVRRGQRRSARCPAREKGRSPIYAST